jgi:hypothetical protein
MIMIKYWNIVSCRLTMTENKNWFGRRKIDCGWGLPQKWQEWLTSYKNTFRFIFLTIFAIIIFVTIQLMILRKAHSTFENYYTFRGCVQLLEKTDTYGICKTSDGKTIKIVEIGNKWYLEGDGPSVW